MNVWMSEWIIEWTSALGKHYYSYYLYFRSRLIWHWEWSNHFFEVRHSDLPNSGVGHLVTASLGLRNWIWLLNLGLYPPLHVVSHMACPKDLSSRTSRARQRSNCAEYKGFHWKAWNTYERPWNKQKDPAPSYNCLWFKCNLRIRFISKRRHVLLARWPGSSIIHLYSLLLWTSRSPGFPASLDFLPPWTSYSVPPASCSWNGENKTQQMRSPCRLKPCPAYSKHSVCSLLLTYSSFYHHFRLNLLQMPTVIAHPPNSHSHFFSLLPHAWFQTRGLLPSC